MSQVQQFRELVHRDEIDFSPGVFDGFTAKLAEQVGFDSVYLGGYATGASTAHTEPIITMSEMCDRAREITEHVDIPLMVDGDAGFGDPAHTYRAITHYAKTGIAAIHIEDQVYPKRLHYHAGEVQLVDEEEMVKKIEAAVQAIKESDEDIFLIARSDAGKRQRREEHGEGIEDAVQRLNAYIDAGAEMGMCTPRSMEELEYVVKNVDGPIHFGMIESYIDGFEPYPTIDVLEDVGVAHCSTPIAANIVAANAVKDLFETIQETGASGIDPDVYAETRSEIEEVIDLPEYYEIEKRTGKGGVGEIHHEGRSD